MGTAATLQLVMGPNDRHTHLYMYTYVYIERLWACWLVQVGGEEACIY